VSLDANTKFCGGDEVFVVITVCYPCHKGLNKDHPVSAVIAESPHWMQTRAIKNTLILSRCHTFYMQNSVHD